MHFWRDQMLPGVNIWSRYVSMAFSEKRFALYVFGVQIVNWFAR